MSDRRSAAIRAVPQPADLNVNGNIFGGWVLSQMDIAGALIAGERARGRVATVAVSEMKFHEPINLGDVVSIYAAVKKVGRTSISINLDVYADKPSDGLGANTRLVTEGCFVYVAIDEDGRPRPVMTGS